MSEKIGPPYDVRPEVLELPQGGADATIDQSTIRHAAVERSINTPRQTMGGARLGTYVVSGTLGEGGMGTVCRARDPLLDREVAIKVLKSGLSSDATARLLREARAAARLAHPNVVAIYHVVEENGQIQIVMELLGRSLADELKETGAMAWRAATVAIRDAAAGIAAAHGSGMVHRDIKPSNLLRGVRGEVKVVDFGIVHSAESVALTMPGSMMGTPAFMAPEQCRGEAADTRSDVYSLACTYYNLLTGRLPFDGTSAYLVMRMHETDSVPVPGEADPHIPAGVRKIIARAGSKDPQSRYKDAAEMLQDLDAVLSGGSTVVSFAPARHGGFGKVMRGVVSFGLILLSIILFVIWKTHRPMPPIAAPGSTSQPLGAQVANSSSVPAVIVQQPTALAPIAVAPVVPPPVAPPSPDLIKNGSFTNGDDAPDDWKVFFTVPFKSFMLTRDTTDFKVGPASLRIDTINGPAFGSVVQSIHVPASAKGRIHITGFAKTRGRKLQFAKVIFHPGGEPDAHNEFPADLGCEIKQSQQWREFALDVPLPLLDAAQANIQIMLKGEGTVWVDELHATIVPPPGAAASE